MYYFLFQFPDIDVKCSNCDFAGLQWQSAETFEEAREIWAKAIAENKKVRIFKEMEMAVYLRDKEQQ